jgi:hypothetical protein
MSTAFAGGVLRRTRRRRCDVTNDESRDEFDARLVPHEFLNTRVSSIRPIGAGADASRSSEVRRHSPRKATGARIGSSSE